MNSIAITSARCLASSLILLGIIPLSGCRICADCEDLAYPAYGGAWQRTRRDSGRVGSLFDPAGARQTELVSRDAPSTPDEIDRQRQSERDRQEDPEERAEEATPDDERIREFEDKEDRLRDIELDDIEQRQEEERLREKELDEINVRLVPGQAPPPILQ